MFVGLRVGVPGQAAVIAPSTGIITANRQVWYRKGTASGATWPDASGNARNLALVGSPTIGATSVTFNGTTQSANVAYNIGLTLTLYFRVRPIAWSSGAFLVTGSSGRSSLRQMTSTPTIAADDSSASGPQSSISMSIGSMHSLCFVNEDGSTLISVDGVDSAGGALDGIAPTPLTVASASGGAANFMNVEIVEIVGYNVAHDATQRAQMKTYMDSL